MICHGLYAEVVQRGQECGGCTAKRDLVVLIAPGVGRSSDQRVDVGFPGTRLLLSRRHRLKEDVRVARG